MTAEEMTSRFMERLKRAIAESGMTQDRIANELGLTPAAVSQWFTKRRIPKLEHAFKLCEVLGIQMSDLVKEEIVMCSECAHLHRCPELICEVYGHEMRNSDFCSRGHKRPDRR